MRLKTKHTTPPHHYLLSHFEPPNRSALGGGGGGVLQIGGKEFVGCGVVEQLVACSNQRIKACFQRYILREVVPAGVGCPVSAVRSAFGHDDGGCRVPVGAKVFDQRHDPCLLVPRRTASHRIAC